MQKPELLKTGMTPCMGDIVVMLRGGLGYGFGVVMLVGKRKSQVRDGHGMLSWVLNTRLHVVDDFRFRCRLEREMRHMGGLLG